MDNMRSYHMKAVGDLLRQNGIIPLYLLPYSPDLKPIEMIRSKMKAILRKWKIRNTNDLRTAIHRVLSLVSESDMLHWFSLGTVANSGDCYRTHQSQQAAINDRRKKANMATMYVDNIPPNETVNLRMTPNGIVLMRIGYGKAVDASPSSTAGWHHVSYDKFNGYIMSKFLSETDPNSSISDGSEGGTYSIFAAVDTTKNGSGGTLNLRQSADASAKIVARIPNGTTICIKSRSGTWLATKYNGFTGYVMAKYIIGTNAYNSSSSGGATSKDGLSIKFTDVVETPFHATTSYPFNPQAAINYAIAHSTNNTSGADPKRNTSFGSSSSNDCANFVNQCLCAGGAPMFDGWCYRIKNIPSSWNTTPWSYTNQSRRAMLERGWITRIHNHEVQAGDIIYMYRPKYKSEGEPTPYKHVTIAVSNYDAARKGCLVCGHSVNQNSEFRSLDSSPSQEAYCYQVKRFLPGNGSEKQIDITDGNSAAL